MSRSKSFRRHHAERLLKKRTAEIVSMLFIGNDPEINSKVLASVPKRAAIAVTSAARCSCWLCGNPRRYRGNSKLSLTKRELVSLDRMTEET